MKIQPAHDSPQCFKRAEHRSRRGAGGGWKRAPLTESLQKGSLTNNNDSENPTAERPRTKMSSLKSANIK